MKKILIVAAMLMAVNPGQAAPASQRVSILKYYQCLAQKVIYPALMCHL